MQSLVERSRQFRVILDGHRRCADSTTDFEWYPYDSLASVQHLEALLGGSDGDVTEAARDEGILDLGCGDGDIGFFFESLGYAVTCVDYPPSNQNGMRGVRALRQKLHSGVAIREADVDNEFPLDGRYGLSLCLGVLYHLKNPVFVLDHLARISRFCLLSTRVARYLPGGAPMPGGHALAYLLGEDELNCDDTNWWIFTEPALRRLFERTRWEVVRLFTVGDTVTSDPGSKSRDERAFCLLRSHYGQQHLDLLDGWHNVERTGWRWTKQRFAARATVGRGMKHSGVVMRVFAPPVLIERLGCITLDAEIDGVRVRPLIIREPGIHTFTARIPVPSETTVAVFCLDKALTPGAMDPRELGIIVASLEFT